MNLSIEIKTFCVYILSTWLNVLTAFNLDLIGSVFYKLSSLAAFVYYCIRIYKELKNRDDVGKNK